MKVDVAYYHIDKVDDECTDTIRLSPDFVGISVLQDELLVIREFVKKIKPLLPNTHITLGNKEVTCQPELIMQCCPEVDSVIIGEGEYTIVDLVERLINKQTLKGCNWIY